MKTSNQEPPAERAGPPVDLVRRGDRLILLASLPGVRPSDLRVSIVGDRQLVLEGEVAYRHPLPRENLALNECTYGPFSRTVHLPLPVDAGGVAVTLQDGVLTVDMRMRAEAVRLQWQPKEAVSGERPR